MLNPLPIPNRNTSPQIIGSPFRQYHIPCNIFSPIMNNTVTRSFDNGLRTPQKLKNDSPQKHQLDDKINLLISELENYKLNRQGDVMMSQESVQSALYGINNFQTIQNDYKQNIEKLLAQNSYLVNEVRTINDKLAQEKFNSYSEINRLRNKIAILAENRNQINLVLRNNNLFITQSQQIEEILKEFDDHLENVTNENSKLRHQIIVLEKQSDTFGEKFQKFDEEMKLKEDQIKKKEQEFEYLISRYKQSEKIVHEKGEVINDKNKEIDNLNDKIIELQKHLQSSKYDSEIEQKFQEQKNHKLKQTQLEIFQLENQNTVLKDQLSHHEYQYSVLKQEIETLQDELMVQHKKDESNKTREQILNQNIMEIENKYKKMQQKNQLSESELNKSKIQLAQLQQQNQQFKEQNNILLSDNEQLNDILGQRQQELGIEKINFQQIQQKLNQLQQYHELYSKEEQKNHILATEYQRLEQQLREKSQQVEDFKVSYSKLENDIKKMLGYEIEIKRLNGLLNQMMNSNNKDIDEKVKIFAKEIERLNQIIRQRTEENDTLKLMLERSRLSTLLKPVIK